MQLSSVGRLHFQDAEPSSHHPSPAADPRHSHKTAPADGGDLEGSSIDETRRWVWADQRTVRFQRIKPFAAGARLLHTSHS